MSEALRRLWHCLAVGSIGLILGVLPCAAEAPAPMPGPLAVDDFEVAGIRVGMAPSEVCKVLGEPLRFASSPNPFDPSLSFEHWHYGDMNVTYYAPDGVSGIEMMSPEQATRRGLRVGDRRDRVLALYGPPSGMYGNDWDYPSPEHELLVLRVQVTGDRVTSIFVGWLAD